MKYVLLGVILFSFTPAFRAQVAMEALLPATIASGTELTFEVKIHKGAVVNFAKYQIDVPAGVTLTEVDCRTGSFSFENNRGKIIWVAIPTESDFVVKLKLNAGNASGSGTFNQKFYFLENGSKKEIEANPVTVNFSSTGGQALTTTMPVQTASPPASTVASSQPVTITEIIPAKAAEPVATKPVEKKPSSEQSIDALKEQFKTVNEPVKTPAPAVAAIAGSDVVYKIQLGAYGEDPGKAKYKGLQDVTIAREGAFYKVLAGSFKNKEDAVKRRAELQSQGFNGFVVAYQNGQRVK